MNCSLKWLFLSINYKGNACWCLECRHLKWDEVNHSLWGLRGKNNFLINVDILSVVFGLSRIWNFLDFIQKVHLFKDILEQPFSGNSNYIKWCGFLSILCMHGKTIVLFPDTPLLKRLQNISSTGASSIWARAYSWHTYLK